MAEETPVPIHNYEPKDSAWDGTSPPVFDSLVLAYIKSADNSFKQWADTNDEEAPPESIKFFRVWADRTLRDKAKFAVARLRLKLADRDLPLKEFAHALTHARFDMPEMSGHYYAEKALSELRRNASDLQTQSSGLTWYFSIFAKYFEAKAGYIPAVKMHDLLGEWHYANDKYAEMSRSLSKDGATLSIDDVKDTDKDGVEYRVMRVPLETVNISKALDDLQNVETNIIALLRKHKLDEDFIFKIFWTFFEWHYRQSLTFVDQPKVQALLRAMRHLQDDRQGPRAGYGGSEAFNDLPGETSPAAVGMRIRDRRLARKMTGAQLAAAVGIKTPQAISAWENGHTMPPDARLEKAAQVLDTTVEYLRSGVRQQLGEADEGAETSYKMLTGDLGQNEATADLVKKLSDVGMIDYAEVPLFTASVSAGSGAVVFEETSEQPLWFRKSFFEKRGLRARNCRCFHVHGDSMEPYLTDGDVVLTGGEPEQIKDGMLYVLRYGTDLRVKRLRTTHTGGMKLMSDNPRYPEEDISASDAEKYITVLGQVYWRGG